MKLTFIGTGAAFTTEPNQFQSNMLLEHNGHRLLIDCGTDARHALQQVGLSYQDITDVYISHLHADHCGGMEWLALKHYFDPQTKKPKLYAFDKILRKLWQNSLQAGLETLDTKHAHLNLFFDAVKLDPKRLWQWHGIQIQLVKTIHTYNNGWLNPSYGLFIQHLKHRIFITTDTRFTPSELNTYYQQATLIFHDCETITPASTVHAHYQDLKSLPLPFKQKMWLYHYNHTTDLYPKQEGFLGFVQTGQSFEFKEVTDV